MKNARRILLVAMSSCFALPFALPLRTTPIVNNSDDLSAIVIGVSNVQSGPSGALGQNLLAGSLAYFRFINEHGGIHGRQIRIVLHDDKYEPDAAVLNTQRLINQDHVFFLFDYVGTPTLVRVLPLLKYYEAQNIVNVAPFTGAEPQRKPPYDKFVFNVRASYRDETRALIRYLYQRGFRRIGLMGQADAYGKSVEVAVIESLAELGLQPVQIVSYHRDQPFESDMTTQVRMLREARAEAVLMVGIFEPAAAFVRDARLTGWDVPVANVSFVGATNLIHKLHDLTAKTGIDMTRNLINSQVVPSYEDTSYPLVRDYRAHTAPESYSFVSLEGWLNAVVVVEALRRAGTSPTRSDLIHALESLHGWDPGIGEQLQFSPSSHQALHRVWLTRSDQARWVSLEFPSEDKR
ncbi:MAG: ABC transporter substrate-binding protein [Candidatus Acidiferrum sp.]